MSYDQWVYKADSSTPPMNKWSEDLSQPIGTREEIKKAFESILGELKWNDLPEGGCWSQGCFTNHGYEISMYSDSNLIRLKGCFQSQAIELAKKLNLCAFDLQTGEQLVS